MGYSEIKVLSNDGINENPNLKTLNLNAIFGTTFERIEDCAFCSFPNLKEVDISGWRSLGYIHENAFGNLDGRNILSLEIFKADNCNLTMIPENLLDWDSIKEVHISRNPFVCDCSMAWLINDFSNPAPHYVDKLRSSFREMPFCDAPEELKDQSFQDVSGTICNSSPNALTFDNSITVCDENQGMKIYRIISLQKIIKIF